MEPYIKCNKNDNNLKDITYMSELNSSFALLRTRWTILNRVKNLAQTTYGHFIP